MYRESFSIMVNVFYLLAFLALVSAIDQNDLFVPPEDRLDCYPEDKPTKELCESRGCYWDGTKRPQPGPPLCSYPKDVGGYKTINVTDTNNGKVAFMERGAPSPYPGDAQLLRVDCEYLTDTILRVKITDALRQRYEAPYPKIIKPNQQNVQPTYEVDFDPNQAGFRVSRAQNAENVFYSFNIGALIFADQFLEITTLLSRSAHLHGIGEKRSTVTITPDWKRYTLFNMGDGVYEDYNLYGSHPFYMTTEPSGLSHGVFLHNSNAMDILTNARPMLTFRTIGGIFDFYFFLGPTPAEVVKQYTSIVGRSFIPPYWSLGFHLCKFGYDTLDNMKAVWKRNRDLEIPFDVQWSDIDFLKDRNDFTYDTEKFAGMPEFIDELHEAGMHNVVIIDAGISGSEPEGTYPPLDIGKEQDLLLKNKNGSLYLGKVWNPVSTAFPDYLHPNIQPYWNKLISDYHDVLPFDGLWIDMNEPAQGIDGSLDGCPDDNLENPPYRPGIAGPKLSTRTACMNVQHATGTHYDYHNLFSIAEADATNQALRNLNKRPFVLSRSTFSGSGRYTGHWTGDDEAKWTDLQKSISALLNFNIFGIPLMGTDICGFRGDTNQELCNRWTQLGAFYTFSRNHNDLGPIDQDPAVFDNKTILSIRRALNSRYTLLPYLYTLFYYAELDGSTVARPVFFEFPADVWTYQVENAFFWGSGLYIIPVVEEGATTVETYLPPGRWFDFYTNAEVPESGKKVTFDAPYDTIPVLFRGGYVVPTQGPAVTTTLSRKNGITLLASPTVNGTADGSLYWDDGEILDPIQNNAFGLLNFRLEGNTFTSTVVSWNTPDVPQIIAIRILGFTEDVTRVQINNEDVEFQILESVTVLRTGGFSIPANVPLKLEWN